MLRVLPFGGYRNRQPLAYAPLRARLRDRIALVDAPQDAQILLISHFKDFALFGARIHAMLAAAPGLRLVLLSEEPFWDSCWMPDPLTRRQRIATAAGPVSCTVLSHQTSAIFRAARIPYFLLTDPRYIAHVRPRFDRNAGWSASDWLRHFRDLPLDAAFLAERRTEARLAPALPQAGLYGLSVWRSEAARLCRGRVLRAGRGWDAGPPRQDLPDWHADKLDRLDLRCRYLSAFENTHQSDYVSEKIWDAFAAGAVPLYAARPGHAVHRLIGPGGWLGFDPASAPPVFDATRPVGAGLAAAYAARQEALARLFADPVVLEAEYDRFCAALLAELAGVPSAPPF